jgi:lysophospholipase L1-like esterase
MAAWIPAVGGIYQGRDSQPIRRAVVQSAWNVSSKFKGADMTNRVAEFVRACRSRSVFFLSVCFLAFAPLLPPKQAAEPPASYKFVLGPRKAAAGYIQVLPATAYSSGLGYGFDLGSKVACVERGGDDVLRGGFCTSDQPFYFSVAVPEGNYRVTVTLGDRAGESVTTVKAESRRLMLEKVRTAAGAFATRTFALNIRNSRLTPPPANAPGGSEVRLNDRERDVLHWDDKLTLEFSNTRPCVAAVEIQKADDIPTIFLAGDSTVTDQPLEPTTSWGQMLTRFFNAGMAIANHAESGETLKSFITGLRLDKILSQIKRGDYLFIQFGHNDMKENWPQTYVEARTTYKAYLKVFIGEARRRGGIPVLVTSMHRRNFDAKGKILNTLGEYPEAVRQTAIEEKVFLIDLHAMSAAFYEALGPAKSPLAFGANGRDATHHSAYGAYELGKCVVEGIKAAKLSLVRYLADDVPPFDPAHPDDPEAWSLPSSPGRTVIPTLEQAVNPALMTSRSSVPPSDPRLPTIFIVGDSTANNVDRRGWGDPFAEYFDPRKINVINRARAGRSSRTFMMEGLWDVVVKDLKAGDFVLIQFGHNDGGPLDSGRARGSLPGLGEETQEVMMPDGNRQIVHTYGWYLRRYIIDVKAKSAIPIVLSPTVRNIWTNGKVERGPGDFGRWSDETAQSQAVAFVDVTNIIANRYEKMGQEKVQEFFPEDHTHTTPAGADLNAAAVVSGLKGLRDCPLPGFLSAKGQAVEPAAVRAAQPGPLFPLPGSSASQPPSLFLIGDSTVRNGRGDGQNGQWGWGEPIAGFFDQTKINVVNRAMGGLSSRTYFTMGHWEKVLAMLKPGDFVMMQFGHNDNGPINDTSRARGTIPGVGEETEVINNLLTREHEIVHTYGWYLRRFIADTRTRGATPLVCSLVPRKVWKDGRIVREKYAQWAAEVAASEGSAFVDLNEIIARHYEQLGPGKVDPLFADEFTHTSLAGAEINAACVIAGLKGLADNPLSDYFSEKAKQPSAHRESFFVSLRSAIVLARRKANHAG